MIVKYDVMDIAVMSEAPPDGIISHLSSKYPVIHTVNTMIKKITLILNVINFY